MALLPPKPPVNAVQPKRTGSGFTNINKVLSANQGNKLGSSVAGGVQNQAQTVKTQTDQSQQAFETEAQKNRLDTDEATQKRDNIIGRFGQSGSAVNGTQQVANQVGQATANNLNATSTQNVIQSQLNNQKAPAPKTLNNPEAIQQQAAQSGVAEAPVQQPANPYNVDMSKFQVSQDLQQQYDQRKQDFINQQQTQGSEAEKQRAAIQARIEADTAKLNQMSRVSGYGAAAQSAKRHGLQQSIETLKNVLSTYGSATQNKEAELNSFLSNLDQEYQTKLAAEQNAFGESERDRLIAANMPTDEEIAEFTKYRTGAYTGPKELENYQTLLGQAGEAETLGGLTRSSGGRQELLRRFVGGDGYNQGQQSLDNLLLGQSGSQDLNAARKSTRGLEQNVFEKNQNASNLAQEYAGKAKTFGEETTNRLNTTKSGVDQKINANLEKLKTEDTGRQNFLNTLKSTFDGTNENTKGLDKIARLGLGLQSAMDAGYLTQDQANSLLGDNGLIKRSEAMGLDTSKLLSERLQDISAENLNRAGAATKEQESQVTALQKLLGKQGADLEFGQDIGDYKKGGIGVNTDSLKDYLTKAEAERAQRDPAFAQQLAQMQPGLLDHAQNTLGGALTDTGMVAGLAGAGSIAGANLGAALGGGAATAGAATGAMAALPAAVGFDMLTGGDTTAQTANSAAQLGLSTIASSQNAKNSILEGLAKLNIGGKSIANTEAGKQLLKLIDYKSKLENQTLGEGSLAANEISGQVGDLTRSFRNDPSKALEFMNTGGASIFADTAKRIGGNIDKALGNVGTNAARGFGAGETGNWDASRYKTVDATTGKRVRIGDFANKSSGDILKQIISSNQLNTTYNMQNNQGNEGAKSMNRLLEYYKQAVARENAAKKKK